MIALSSFTGGSATVPPAHTAPNSKREFLMPLIARSRVNFSAPMPRHLNGDVGRGAKSVQAQPAAALYARKPQRPESDDARAQQRRGLEIVEAFRNRIDEALFRQGVLGVTAVHGPAGEGGIVAEIFFRRPAIFARAVGGVQPGDADPRPNVVLLRAARPRLRSRPPPDAPA